MSLVLQPDDFQFEVQGTQYFLRFSMDADIGEVFTAAKFDPVSEEWGAFIFKEATQTAIDYYGGGTLEGFMQYLIDDVNAKLEEWHGEPPQDTLLAREKAFLNNNVILEDERLKIV